MLTMTTYLKSLLLLLTLWLLVNVSFNLLIDPFSAYHWVYREGFNAVKSRAAKFERIATPLMLERVQAERLYMGSSRTEIALAGDSPALAGQVSRTTINLGMRGASIYETMLLLQHALQVAPVQEAIVGLEIHAFNTPSRGRTELDAYVARDWQGKPNYGYRLQQFRDSLFALDVTANSIATLERQADADDLMTEDGRYLAAKTLSQALDGGSLRDYFGRWLGVFVKLNWTPCRSGEVVFRYNRQFDSFARFRDLLTLAAEHGISLKLFISPSHVLLMEAMRQSGVWPYSELWKTRMVDIVEQVNGQYGTDFSIVDFEAVDQISTEPVPVTGEGPMHWFIDPVHFTPALGDAMLARLLQTDKQPRWGTTLRRDQLPQQLRQLRQSMEQYHRDNPEAVRFVRDIVEHNLPLRAGASTCQQRPG